MIASSPTTAALLCASSSSGSTSAAAIAPTSTTSGRSTTGGGNSHQHHYHHHHHPPNSPTGFSPRSRCYDGVSSLPSHLQNNLTFPPPSASPTNALSRQPRPAVDPGTASAAGDSSRPFPFIAVRRPTVDAATQYSRPASPVDRTQHQAAPVPSSVPSVPCGSQQSTQAFGSGGSGVASSSIAQPSMPGIPTGSKRNTPDTTASSTTTATATATAAAATAATKAQLTSHSDRHELDVSLSKRLRPEKPPPKVLPRRYENADPRDLVVLISSMLMELIRYNDQIPLRDGSLTRFHSRSPPRISVKDYLQRLTTHATLSPPILLSMVYYIDRLCMLYPAFTISSLTVHRFLISSATVASKGLSDSFWTNRTYARVGGISVAELALLELEFLWRVEWRIVPQPEVLADYYRSLVERCEDYVLEPEDPGESKPAAPNTTNHDTSSPS